MNPCPTCSSYNYSDLSICSSCGQWLGIPMFRKGPIKKLLEIHSITRSETGAPPRKPSPISLDKPPHPAYIAVPQDDNASVKARIAELATVLRRAQIYIDAAEYCLDRRWLNRFASVVASCQRTFSPYVTDRPTYT